MLHFITHASLDGLYYLNLDVSERSRNILDLNDGIILSAEKLVHVWMGVKQGQIFSDEVPTNALKINA